MTKKPFVEHIMVGKMTGSNITTGTNNKFVGRMLPPKTERLIRTLEKRLVQLTYKEEFQQANLLVTVQARRACEKRIRELKGEQ